MSETLVEMVISRSFPENSTFCGSTLEDNPVFRQKRRDEKIPIIEALSFLSGNGWTKIHFSIENPFDSMVFKDNGAKKLLRNFELRYRGPLAGFMTAVVIDTKKTPDRKVAA